MGPAHSHFDYPIPRIRQRPFPSHKRHGFFLFLPTFSYHLPHDYAMGTDIFIHAHWSHNSSLVTGGDIVWAYELTYAKGHNQASFSTPIIFTATQAASTSQYRHQLVEVSASVIGGGPTQLNTSLLEPDGLIFGRLYLSTNGITVSSGGVPDPFLHMVDMHYQSTGIPTKQDRKSVV